MTILVKNLKALRTKKGLSQQKLADALGLSQQSIYKYETQWCEPDIDMLKTMADFFNTSVDYLIGHSEINRKYEAVTPYDLNEDEAALMDSYRSLTQSEKESIHLIIKNYNLKN